MGIPLLGLEQLHQLVQKIFHFTPLKPTFLFYTLIFTKHPHQFIYSTHLFNKTFTDLTIPTISPHPTTIIKENQPTQSEKQTLWNSLNPKPSQSMPSTLWSHHQLNPKPAWSTSSPALVSSHPSTHPSFALRRSVYCSHTWKKKGTKLPLKPDEEDILFFQLDLRWEENEFLLSLFLFSSLFEWLLFSILSNDLIKWGKGRVRVWWLTAVEAWFDRR